MTEISADYLLGLRLKFMDKSPFFATLLSFAKFEITDSIPTAATNGKSIKINPEFFGDLNVDEQYGVLLHEVMHNALGHLTRRGSRDPLIWNMAADYAENLIIVDSGFVLPNGCLLDKKFKNNSAEEIYEILLKDADKQKVKFMGDLEESGSGSESYWKSALQGAVSREEMSKDAGSSSVLRSREILGNLQSRVDWRTALRDFLSVAYDDFSGWDRRFVWQGMYLDGTYSEKVNLVVAIDTSASISEQQLSEILAEVRMINDLYPNSNIDLYYWDAGFTGPYDLNEQTLAKPEGGGGTCLCPLWEHLEEIGEARAVVVFTDGWIQGIDRLSNFTDTLWCLTVPGITPEEILFGKTIQMFSE